MENRSALSRHNLVTFGFDGIWERGFVNCFWVSRCFRTYLFKRVFRFLLGGKRRFKVSFSHPRCVKERERYSWTRAVFRRRSLNFVLGPWFVPGTFHVGPAR